MEGGSEISIFVILIFFFLISGASQAGMTGFGAFRNTTVAMLQAQDQRSQVNIFFFRLHAIVSYEQNQFISSKKFLLMDETVLSNTMLSYP